MKVFIHLITMSVSLSKIFRFDFDVNSQVALELPKRKAKIKSELEMSFWGSARCVQHGPKQSPWIAMGMQCALHQHVPDVLEREVFLAYKRGNASCKKAPSLSFTCHLYEILGQSWIFFLEDLEDIMKSLKSKSPNGDLKLSSNIFYELLTSRVCLFLFLYS